MNCRKLIVVVILLLFSLIANVSAQNSDKSTIKIPVLFKTDTVYVDSVEYGGMSLAQQKSFTRQVRRDDKRAHKKVWLTPLGGPSYTPEASLGVGGAVLASFRMSKKDTLSYRSFLPAGFNVSINGTFIVAGAGTLFFNENKFRIYLTYGFRNEPTHYYGKGFDRIALTHRSDTTTAFKKQSIVFNPKFVWEVAPKLFVGGIVDLNYSRSSRISEGVAEDPYFQRFRPKYFNVGLGALVQYDTRDDIATPGSGVLLSASGKAFSRSFGGAYNYGFAELEYRQFQPLFKRALLAWVVKSQIGIGNVPFTELPMFGSPFDLRGYYWGKYRDKSMAYGIVEYRHMFGTKEDLKYGRLKSKFGYVAWLGTGTLGNTPAQWDRWKLNYGVGLRIQIQPRKNFRIDIGKEHGGKGVLFYLNMTEAF